MKKRNFQKGAVSVFLVIVLIPCMVISSMFVDMSRVVLAKGYTTSAADLALNSLMANYDPDLSEYYGMVASCQNIDQFYEESAQFFLEALYSQGLNADDAESMLAWANSFVVGEGVHDLFQLDVQTETSKIVSPVPNASIGESAVIIKDDIVEFMKYRGPIEITSKIVERLANSNAASTLGNASKDEALVEDKKDYANAEEDFMDAAYKTFKKVKEYEALRSGYSLDASKMSKMLTDMKNARETYREVIALMVSNLNGTSTLPTFTRPTRTLNAYSYTYKSTLVHSTKGKDDSGNDVYYINAAKVDKLLDGLETDIKAFKEARDNVATTAGDTLVNASIGTGSSQYNPIQWWKKVNSLINYGNGSPIATMGNKADNMLKSYSKVKAMADCTPTEDVPADWTSRRDSLMQSVQDLQKDFLTAGVGEKNNNKYLRLVNKLEKYSKDYKSKTDPTKVKLSNGKTVSTAITDVDTLLSQHAKQLGECIDLLNTIINGGGLAWTNPYSLDKLSSKATEYKSTYNTWKTTASGMDTTLAENDKAEIAEKEKNGSTLAVGSTEIGAFKTRLINVRDKLQSVKNTIEGMKLGSKKLIDIANYDTAYNAVKSDIGENLTNSAIATKAANIFKNKFTPYSSSKDAAVANIDFSNKNYSPLLTENETAFHKWMYEKFRSIKDDSVTKAKNKKESKKKEGEDKATEAKNADRSTQASKISLHGNKDYVGDDFPSGLDGRLEFKLGSSVISSLATTVSSLVNMSIDGIRDSLYATEYVMDMFSYATYVNEGMYRLGMETKNWSAADAEKAYKTGYADVKGNKDTEKTWLSEKLTDRYNKTLTNKMINSTNNILHGAEVEYVLYGKDNKTNITKAYVDIFEIRYVLNTVSGFQNFWSPTANETASLINSAAAALSSATGGVVPAAAIKCVSILLMTALETGSDLDRLSKGFQVELYKATDEEWVCAFSVSGEEENTDFSANVGAGKACENGLFYSDYLYLFVLLGFQSDSASEMYRRTADLIQVNMRQYTGDKTYKLKNSKKYFQINATIRVEPLMLALPMAQLYANNPSDRSDWCTFKIQEKRGYS